MGSRGAGSGGGGDSVGIGGLRPGSGRGNNGKADVDLAGRGKGKTRVLPGRSRTIGPLSKSLKFPKPRGGGVVVVTYPLRVRGEFRAHAQ